MNIITFFITHAEPSVLMQPRKTTLHNPAIDTKTTAIFSKSLGQHWSDTFFSKLLTMRLAVITAVTQNGIRTLKRPSNFSCNSRNAINQMHQLSNIVTVGTGQSYCQRDTICVGYHMVLRAFFAAIRRVWASFCPPKTARTEEESTTAREKSICSALRSLLNSTSWILFQTPAFCQSLRRRQQVIPEPQPNSGGRSSQPIPVLSTKRMPVRAALSGIDFRPGYRNLRFFFGIIGSIICHSSSLRICFAMSSLHATNSNIQLLMLSSINIKKVSFC
jgi:hypothetical protein